MHENALTMHFQVLPELTFLALVVLSPLKILTLINFHFVLFSEGHILTQVL